MRESTLRIANYISIVVLLVTLIVHFATQSFVGVSSHEDALTYDSVIGRYREAILRVSIGLLLVSATFHGILSLRTILLEVRSTPGWKRAITAGAFALGAVMIGWGLRTLYLTGG